MIAELVSLHCETYSNDLHDSLVKKNGTAFWQTWGSKFDSKGKCTQVDGCVDTNVIASRFATNFMKVYSCNNPQRAQELNDQYSALRDNYCGLPLSDAHNFDTELVKSLLT